MPDNNKFPNNVLTINTMQIGPFKTLMTALKDILSDTNINFTPQGISIVNMDKSHNVIVQLDLPAQNFDEFECKKEKIIIGVNVIHLFKLINSIENTDCLSIYIENKDYDEGVVDYLTLKFENGNINQCKIHRLKLIEPDPEELCLPVVNFSSVITLPSQDFQRIIRDLSVVSDRVEITSVGKELIFKAHGSFADSIIRRSEMDGQMSFIEEQDASIVFQGEYQIKFLNYFVKCTNLCQNIEINLENNLPLVLKYDVASLGYIRLGLSTLPSESELT